tara:strand:+ start:612 stop:1079 length:468 start_codon:yes stop_codon:yes gene_type:complete
MPIKYEKLTPHVAFSVEYQGKIIPIFHAYDEDDMSRKLDEWFTADVNEGVRDHQTKKEGLLGEVGYTMEYNRDEWYFCTHKLFEKMKYMPEFQDERKQYSWEWDASLIVQTAINYGLIGFDDDYRFVNTMMIEDPIKSCTGGFVYPYEIKEVSNG